MHRKCLDLLEVLVKNARSKDKRFSSEALACVVAFVRSRDPFSAHHAAKVLLRLTRHATARGEMWKSFAAEADAAQGAMVSGIDEKHAACLQLDGGWLSSPHPSSCEIISHALDIVR